MPFKDPVKAREYHNAWQREHKSSTRSYRIYPERRAKQRARDLRVYGLTPEQYTELVYAQRGVCAICLKAEIETGNGGGVRGLAVDHDHETGQVRGLLCRRCNVGLGHFKDDPALLRLATAYLERG